MKRTILACAGVLVISGAAATACSSSSDGNNPNPVDGGSGEASTTGDGGLTVACSDTDDAIYADPGAITALAAGDIVKCASDAPVTAADVKTQLGGVGYVGKDPTSGARVYRILYRTERGDDAKSAGTSSALVYLPDTPKAAQLPVVVASHGSRGQATLCAPSRNDPAGQYVEDDFVAQVMPLVGAGYAVIAPDLAGYANYGAAGNPPSAYADALDVGKSTLDAARALRKMIPGLFNDKTVLVGHSQGGGTALGALAISADYAPDLKIAGTAVYAPLWFSQATWGALFLVADSYPIADSPTPTAVSIWYHYTHGELLDGPGHGLDPFKDTAKASIKQFVDQQCWAASYPALEALGTTAKDIFDPAFVSSIGAPAALGSACDSGDDVCAKWKARYAADRPHLTGAAASAPLLVLYGGQDTTITPDRATCVFDRLTTDAANYKVCFEPTANHGGIVRMRADYVNDWIAGVALGQAAPADCPENQSDLVDDAGAAIKCATPPPND